MLGFRPLTKAPLTALESSARRAMSAVRDPGAGQSQPQKFGRNRQRDDEIALMLILTAMQ